jgi:Flp pilus assembly protein TadD
MLLDRGDAAGAARLLVELAPRDPEAACLLARALRELGDPEGAAAAERSAGPVPCALRP